MEIIIDTDPGMGTLGGDPEDGFAIMLALQSPELQVRAITVVHGNVPLANAYSNAVHLLRLLDRTDIPLAPGLAGPLMPRRTYQHFREQRQFAPWAAPEAAPCQAVDLLLRTVLGSAGGITLVPIGPLTNIAAAILADARFAPAVREIVVMGGSATIPGNITPVAEFNIFADPEAAAIVFNAGIPIVMVGLDVCHQTSLTPTSIPSLDEASPLGRFVYESSADWFEVRRANWDEGESFYLYDSLAMAITFQRDLVKTKRCWVDVEIAGTMTAGQTVAYLSDFNKHWVGDKTNCDVCLEVDNARFERIFQERVLRLLRR